MLKIITNLIEKDGNFPNNSELPLLYYVNAFDLEHKNGQETIKKMFLKNFWYRPWIDGIYNFHHYHSNNHEVLGVAKGKCSVQFGGENGIFLEISKGDVLVLPAGTTHKKIESTNDFTCVGAYSIDVDYDMKYGEKDELASSIKRIHSLETPKIDPVFGEDGPLLKYWKEIKK